MQVELFPNEVVIKASDSKLITDSQAVTGKLILTNQRVFFTDPESVGKDVSIWPSAIKEIIHFNTGLFTRNGIQIVMKDGVDHRFTVKDRDGWTLLINRMY